MSEKKRVSDLRIGYYIMIKDRPCKITDMYISKGYPMKAYITALDIFNGTKNEIVRRTETEICVPEIKTFMYTLLDIDQDGYISLISNDNKIREDLHFTSSLAPVYFSDLHAKQKEIEKSLLEKDVIVVTLKALDIEMITEFK